MGPPATVRCPDCGFEGAFDSLGDARAWLDDHERETGHDPTWELAELSPGVERAGAAAGVCGVPDSVGELHDESQICR